MNDLTTDIRSQMDDVTTMLSGTIGDFGLETFLDAMKAGIWLSQHDLTPPPLTELAGYHDHIAGITAVYVFKTRDESILASVRFGEGQMQIEREKVIRPWNINICFKDVSAFWKFVGSGGENILDSILNNDVEAYGNWNYLNKFGYMARDFLERLGIEP